MSGREESKEGKKGKDGPKRVLSFCFWSCLSVGLSVYLSVCLSLSVGLYA